jgi:hypothetical protein
MRRLIALAVIAAVSAGMFGCEDKKTEPPTVEAGTMGMKAGNGAPPPPPPPPLKNR